MLLLYIKLISPFYHSNGHDIIIIESSITYKCDYHDFLLEIMKIFIKTAAPFCLGLACILERVRTGSCSRYVGRCSLCVGQCRFWVGYFRWHGNYFRHHMDYYSLGVGCTGDFRGVVGTVWTTIASAQAMQPLRGLLQPPHRMLLLLCGLYILCVGHFSLYVGCRTFCAGCHRHHVGCYSLCVGCCRNFMGFYSLPVGHWNLYVGCFQLHSGC